MDTATFLNVATPDNIHKEIFVNKVQSNLRSDIHYFLLKRKVENEDSEDEYNEYFDLQPYSDLIGFEEIQVVLNELESMGWSYELRYGGTSAFIFIGDLPQKCKY